MMIPTLTFDLNRRTGPMLHGSMGCLYGVSEINVPSFNLLKPLRPGMMIQKAADGRQHPSGDVCRVGSFLEACGTKNIQVYLQDYYLEWPYEANGIDDYREKVTMIVSTMLSGKSPAEVERFSFVIFNEPDCIWYGGRVFEMCKDWLTIYRAIKAVHPDAKVAGPNYATYRERDYEIFFRFCHAHDCLPEYVTWHDLQKERMEDFPHELAHMRRLIQTYYPESGITPVIFVNETVNFDDVGAPGPLVGWIALFEEAKVYSSLPYWGLANSLNELAADANKPNGAWWVYKWYAEMTGETAALRMDNVPSPSSRGNLQGLCSIDDERRIIQVIFGGQSGRQQVIIDHFPGAKAFVTIYSSKFSGHHGFAPETPVIYQGHLPAEHGRLTIELEESDMMTAYYAVITPGAADAELLPVNRYEKNWSRTWEAEDALLLGSAKAFWRTAGNDLARSGRGEAGNLFSEQDGVEFLVSVPETGRYRLTVFYSVQAPQVNPMTLAYVAENGQNRAIGANMHHSLWVDGRHYTDLCYESTVKWGYINRQEIDLELAAGEHQIRLMHKGEDQSRKPEKARLCAVLDKIELALVKVENPPIRVPGYLAAGIAKARTEFEFTVVVPKDGFYRVNGELAGGGMIMLWKNIIRYAPDAKADSPVSLDWIKLASSKAGCPAGGVNLDFGRVYLAAGANILKLTGEQMAICGLTLTYDQALTASRSHLISERVEPFRGGYDHKFIMEVDCDRAGDYVLSLFYANNEPAPIMRKADGDYYIHPYNTDLVERYAQISINDQPPATVYFRNTLSWDTVKNVLLDVQLKKGKNRMIISNDNSYQFSEVQDDFTPRFERFVIAPAAVAEAES